MAIRPAWFPDSTLIAAMQAAMAESMRRRGGDELMSGTRRGGRGSESPGFAAYRLYTPGDDPRRLDWKLYARSDHPYIRETEPETAVGEIFIVDRSASMRWHGDDNSGDSNRRTTKEDYARTLTAAIAAGILGIGDAVGAISVGDDATWRELPVSSERSVWESLIDFLDAPLTSSGMLLENPLCTRIGWLADAPMRPRRIRILSDFLELPDVLRSALTSLRERHHRVTLLHIIDPAERDFPYTGTIRFRDPESGRATLVATDAARAMYLERFERFTEQLRRFCDERGIGYRRLITGSPSDVTLATLIDHDDFAFGSGFGGDS